MHLCTHNTCTCNQVHYQVHYSPVHVHVCAGTFCTMHVYIKVNAFMHPQYMYMYMIFMLIPPFILLLLYSVQQEKMKFLVIATKTGVEVYAWAQRPYSKFMAFKVCLCVTVHVCHCLSLLCLFDCVFVGLSVCLCLFVHMYMYMYTVRVCLYCFSLTILVIHVHVHVV